MCCVVCAESEPITIPTQPQPQPQPQRSAAAAEETDSPSPTSIHMQTPSDLREHHRLMDVSQFSRATLDAAQKAALDTLVERAVAGLRPGAQRSALEGQLLKVVCRCFGRAGRDATRRAVGHRRG